MAVSECNYGQGMGNGVKTGVIKPADWDGTSQSSKAKVALGFKPKRIAWIVLNSTASNVCAYWYDENYTGFFGVQGSVSLNNAQIGAGAYWNGLYSVDDVGSASNPTGGFTISRYVASYSEFDIIWYAE